MSRQDTLSAWRDKIDEIRELGITEACLFPTAIGPSERRELFKELEDSPIKKIPFAHLRNDMGPPEIDLLINRYGTEKFNIHSEKVHPLNFDLSAYSSMIYIENQIEPLDERELERYAGICLDLSHMEEGKIWKRRSYNHNMGMLKKYGCGCWHISAMSAQGKSLSDSRKKFSSHYFYRLEEFNYIIDYLPYMPDIAALEVENTIKEQLAAIGHISGLIAKAREE